jgi:hypothetical protein
MLRTGGTIALCEGDFVAWVDVSRAGWQAGFRCGNAFYLVRAHMGDGWGSKIQ